VRFIPPLLLVASICLSLLNQARVCRGSDVATADVVAASGGFVVHSYRGGPSAGDVLQQALALADQIKRVYRANTGGHANLPRCAIVLHKSRASYAAAVGAGAAQTSGRSLVQSRGRRVVSRRIDLLVDEHNRAPALAHELTHILLAGHFGAQRIPRWADEGLALLFDADEKQQRHDRDLSCALNADAAIRLVELLALERVSSFEQMGVFYAQSLSLVRFLVERESPAQFVSFIERSGEVGYERALRELYAIEGVAQLERLWLQHATASPAVIRNTSFPAAE
jgi:hypothetical protein